MTKEKIFKILIGIGITIVIIFFILFIWEMIDFYNDFKCSTTTSLEWFDEHNCYKYYR